MTGVVAKGKEKVHTSIRQPKMGIVGNFGVDLLFRSGRTFVLFEALTTEEIAALVQQAAGKKQNAQYSQGPSAWNTHSPCLISQHAHLLIFLCYTHPLPLIIHEK
jgi:hypothetical protein